MHITLYKKEIDTVFKKVRFDYLPMEVKEDGIDLWAIKVRPKELRDIRKDYDPVFMEIWCIDHRIFYGDLYRFNCSERIDRLYIYGTFKIVLYFSDKCEFDNSIMDKFYLEFFDQCRNKILVKE